MPIYILFFSRFCKFCIIQYWMMGNSVFICTNFGQIHDLLILPGSISLGNFWDLSVFKWPCSSANSFLFFYLVFQGQFCKLSNILKESKKRGKLCRFWAYQWFLTPKIFYLSNLSSVRNARFCWKCSLYLYIAKWERNGFDSLDSANSALFNIIPFFTL